MLKYKIRERIIDLKRKKNIEMKSVLWGGA
jgi:hypothetical protein